VMARPPMAEAGKDPNLAVYNSPGVTAHYASLSYLSSCEALLFETFLRPGMTILDLGVGGGRTTHYLSGLASRYVGVDYAPEMVAVCQSKFPQLEFRVANASDLSGFADHTFDAVVMAFNGMDYVIPDESRFRSLREIHRTLKPGGVLIFSSHNPRAILARALWDSKRVDDLAHRITRSAAPLFAPVRMALRCARIALAFARSAVESTTRTLRRVPTPAFWRGEGYLLDSAHGGLCTHYALPVRVIPELEKFGYRLLRVQGDDYPQPSRVYITKWYYYVFAKADIPASQVSCA
jgi:ubiquinone/menaquinone biosynthesis C-methylase UbiE